MNTVQSNSLSEWFSRDGWVETFFEFPEDAVRRYPEPIVTKRLSAISTVFLDALTNAFGDDNLQATSDGRLLLVEGLIDLIMQFELKQLSSIEMQIDFEQLKTQAVTLFVKAGLSESTSVEKIDQGLQAIKSRINQHLEFEFLYYH
jgi:hypothetical protein